MGAYTSKYTGQQIDGLLEQVEVGGSGTSNSTGGNNPTGTIISFMGLVAPEGYLICDGSEINIADYSLLASHFETQFGTKNHFGGDGTTTFALPDLRNEFLRGYHSGADTQLSGEVGMHQDATEHVNVYQKDTVNQIGMFLTKHEVGMNGQAYNTDTETSANNYVTTSTYNSAGGSTSGRTAYYSSRPTNVAVLYCIKY